MADGGVAGDGPIGDGPGGDWPVGRPLEGKQFVNLKSTAFNYFCVLGKYL